MENNMILKWELTGFVFITILGTLLHFCFEWSGRFVPLALFCSVNESVWEHLKLGFWPCLFYALMEYLVWGKGEKSFIAAKVLSLYIIPLSITFLFYSYTALTGSHNLIMDISIFVLSVAAAQYASYRILTSGVDLSAFNKAAPVLLLLIVLAFSLFTFYPPKLQLFIDPRTGSSGIQ